MTFHHRDLVAARLRNLGFPRDAASQLSRNGTLLHLTPGKVLCHEGERGTQAFLVLEGEAIVVTRDTPVEVGPGAVVGELATLDPRRTRNATVIARTPLRVLVFDVATYRSLAGRDDLRERLAPQRVAA